MIFIEDFIDFPINKRRKKINQHPIALLKFKITYKRHEEDTEKCRLTLLNFEVLRFQRR
jgi:hypothetical protein